MQCDCVYISMWCVRFLDTRIQYDLKVFYLCMRVDLE